jgi:teichuronic acid biosynthesis glycosyltransferase TuaC
VRLAVIAGDYPFGEGHVGGTFVRQFVHALARSGVLCTVIAPLSVVARRNWPLCPRMLTEDSGGQPISAHWPRYVSFSARQLPGFNTALLTQRSFNGCVASELRRLSCTPDLVYGHFLYCAGRAAVVAASKLGRPAVVSVGEGEFWSVRPFGFAKATQDFRSASGFLAVSSDVRDGLIRDLAIPAGKIRVFPNGVDLTLFKPGNRLEARHTFGISDGQFVIAFVGHFDRKKGLEFLLEAVRGLAGIALLLLGTGHADTDGCHIAFRGTLPHSDVPRALAAADVFVLPTQVEGSCNSALEAMACGLPIVTSNGSYMDDIVDDGVAVRVDPIDVRAIRDAIVALMNDPARRRSMSQACLEKSKQFDINLRARRVTGWLEGIVQASRTSDVVTGTLAGAGRAVGHKADRLGTVASRRARGSSR